ncbi:hypothetical protein PsYK624_173270 [Phanerochaete sordida]|uniref:Uncharacterized protein n=1 Tax=Phanerochaete sordida TaxID=48140 RepID=A0A9P3LN79_9APHY|nr:hypothetical protein PsYK624_173270 [Phanerochaete sordida]
MSACATRDGQDEAYHLDVLARRKDGLVGVVPTLDGCDVAHASFISRRRRRQPSPEHCVLGLRATEPVAVVADIAWSAAAARAVSSPAVAPPAGPGPEIARPVLRRNASKCVRDANV